MAARGCGDSRTAGGVYAACGLSAGGSPIEAFLVDPPIVVDKHDYGLSSKGTTWMERDGVWHLLDIVGENYYPNVADFIEEARRLGISRRLSSKLDFSRLTNDSRIILLHRRAHINNASEYGREKPCPCNVTDHHHSNEGMCAGLWWEDITNGERVGEGDVGRLVKRTMPSFEYEGKEAPEGIVFNYSLAIFASFPILALEVIRDPDGDKHDKPLERAKSAKIDVNLVDE